VVTSTYYALPVTHLIWSTLFKVNLSGVPKNNFRKVTRFKSSESRSSRRPCMGLVLVEVGWGELGARPSCARSRVRSSRTHENLSSSPSQPRTNYSTAILLGIYNADIPELLFENSEVGTCSTSMPSHMPTFLAPPGFSKIRISPNKSDHLWTRTISPPHSSVNNFFQNIPFSYWKYNGFCLIFHSSEFKRKIAVYIGAMPKLGTLKSHPIKPGSSSYPGLWAVKSPNNWLFSTVTTFFETTSPRNGLKFSPTVSKPAQKMRLVEGYHPVSKK